MEIGLTDKADAARWAFADLWAHGIAPSDVIVAGDEFGLLGGVPGSDSLMLVPEAEGCLAVTVGAEPFGPPPGVLALPGGPDRILDVLDDQLRRRQHGEPPVPMPGSSWRVVIDGIDEEREPVRSTVLTLADGCIGTTGAPLLSDRAAAETRAAGFYEGDGPEEHLAIVPPWNQLDAPLDAGCAAVANSRPAHRRPSPAPAARRIHRCQSWSSARLRNRAPPCCGLLGVTRSSVRSTKEATETEMRTAPRVPWPST